jgi:CBS domain containing-hemolysin-like protein
MQAAVAMDVLIAALFFVNLMLARDQLSGTVAGPLMLVGSMVSFLVLVLLFVSAKMLGQQRYGPMVVVASAIFLLIAFGVFCAAAALGIALLKVPAIHWSWRLLYPVLVLLCYVIGFLLNVAAGFKSLILVTRRPEGA